MANDDPPLPGFSGTGDSLYGSFRRERAQKLGGFKRESVKIGTGGSGFFSGGVFSSGGMRLQLGVALTLSIAAGSVAGVILGGKTGVKPGLEAGSRLDAAMLAPNGLPNANAAAQTDPTPEMAHMLDEMRGLRAQIEQLRHGVETARTADRSRAQETAHDASLEARQQALDQHAPPNSPRSIRGWPGWSAPAPIRRPSARSPSPRAPGHGATGRVRKVR